MLKWTELQKEYVKDIEKNLKIAYDGDKSRKSASKFISKHKKANYEYLFKLGLVKSNTGYKKLFCASDEALRFIDKYYSKSKRFSEDQLEGEWNSFVEGLV